MLVDRALQTRGSFAGNNIRETFTRRSRGPVRERKCAVRVSEQACARARAAGRVGRTDALVAPSVRRRRL